MRFSTHIFMIPHYRICISHCICLFVL